jgi:hypothetical protein
MIEASAPPLAPPTESTPAPLVEVVAPDGYSAALLVEFAAPLFSAEIVEDSGFIVRLRPPASPGSALRVRLLVESWLEAVPLPCVTLFHADRSYLIRRQLSRCEPHVGHASGRRSRRLLASVSATPGG